MAPEKVTIMELNVDLKCFACYNKVKKVIAKIPQIRDQIYDVEKNKVKITVICCSPEKIRDKLCYKGGKSIQSIAILEIPKFEPEKPKKPKEVDKPKPIDDKSNNDSWNPKEPEQQKPLDNDKLKASNKMSKEEETPHNISEADPKLEIARMVLEPVNGYPQTAYPMVAYGQYYEGYRGGPFRHEYGLAMPKCNTLYGYGYEYGTTTSYMSSDYYDEENSQGCSIM